MIAHNSNTDQSSAGSGFTELADISHSSPMRGAISEWRNSADTTVDASWVDTGSTIGIALELKQATSGGGGPGKPSYRYYNGHGDLAAETDTAGTRTAAYTYDPIAAPQQSAPVNSAVERWTGRWDKKLDTASALVEMGARLSTRRSGDSCRSVPLTVDPQDAYDYAYQDPINAFDLGGQCPLCERRAGGWNRALGRAAAIRASVRLMGQDLQRVFDKHARDTSVDTQSQGISTSSERWSSSPKHTV